MQIIISTGEYGALMATVQIIVTVAATQWRCACGEVFGFTPEEWPRFPQGKVNVHLKRCKAESGDYLMSHAYRIRRGIPTTPPIRWHRCARPEDTYYDRADVVFAWQNRPGVF